MEKLTAKSSWHVGAKVCGTYCGKKFSGHLNDRCRPTPDGRNVIFSLFVDQEFTLFGQTRKVGDALEIWTNNHEDEIFVVADEQVVTVIPANQPKLAVYPTRDELLTHGAKQHTHNRRHGLRLGDSFYEPVSRDHFLHGHPISAVYERTATIDDFGTPNRRDGHCPDCGQPTFQAQQGRHECSLCNWTGQRPNYNKPVHSRRPMPHQVAPTELLGCRVIRV